MESRAGQSDTRGDLIRGAIAVIGAKGLRGFTLRAVAAQAGLTHGMIVHHFGTRDNLIEAAMEYSMEVSLSGAAPRAAGEPVPPLGDHVAQVAADAAGNVAFSREVFNEAARNERLRPLVNRMYDQYEQAVTAQLEAAGVVDPSATVFFAAAMDGILRRQLDTGDSAATQDAIRLMNRIVALLAEDLRRQEA